MDGENSLSVIKLKNILLVTVPDDPGDDIIHELQTKVLHAIEKYQSKGLILDISSVNILDSFFARTISETTQMVALMGGKTVIAGMQPSVAITATELGLHLGKAISTLDVDRALDIFTDNFKLV
ncbi:MAG: STAS domain-containing protein [Methylococcales bacterium]|nr:STAS domain-containing protein [Methylococcales bacterium]MDD5754762.1 STAS domain-containing protein [Methylococcales bacterium]